MKASVWRSGKQSVVLLGFFVGMMLAPEFCFPAFLGSMATMFAAYLDNYEEA